MGLLAKIFGLQIMEIDKDCPFEPDHVNGRPILVKIGNKVLVG